MNGYKQLEEYCLNRFGSRAAMEANLPVPRDSRALRTIGDDREVARL